MVLSWCLFLLLLGGCCLLAVYSVHKNSKFSLVIIIGLLTIITGLRAESVGLDTKSYIKTFELIRAGKVDQVYGFEKSFVFICEILLKIYDNPHFILFVLSLLTNIFIVFRLWDFKNIASFPWMIFIYFTSFYFNLFNIARQMCAVAIVFFATRFLQQKKYFNYLIFLFLAILFHKSAFIGVLFLCLEFFMWRYLNVCQKRWLIVCFVISPVILIYAWDVFIEYSHYFQDVNFNFGIMLILKAILVVISSIGLLSRIKNRQQLLQRDPVIYSVKTVRVYYFIGIIITSLGYTWLFMDRIGLAFYLFECVYWGIVVKNSCYRQWFKLIIGSLFFIIFILSLINNGQGVLPFSFI